MTPSRHLWPHKTNKGLFTELLVLIESRIKNEEAIIKSVSFVNSGIGLDKLKSGDVDFSMDLESITVKSLQEMGLEESDEEASDIEE